MVLLFVIFIGEASRLANHRPPPPALLHHWSVSLCYLVKRISKPICKNGFLFFLNGSFGLDSTCGCLKTVFLL